MYTEDKPLGGGGVTECRRPRNGATMTVNIMSINKVPTTVFVVDDVLYTDEAEAINIFNKLMYKLKGEWDNWLAKNTE